MVVLTDSIVYIRTKTATNSVKKLNLWGCEIDDISLCEKMTNLQVLSLSLNKVKSLQPLKNCKQLQELYLRKNEIESFSELEHLKVDTHFIKASLKDLKELRVLWIDENPCTAVGEYRHKLLKILPQLTTLDDKPVVQEDFLAPEEREPPTMREIIATNTEAIVDTVLAVPVPNQFQIMPAQFVQYGDTSEDEDSKRGLNSMSQSMTQSIYISAMEPEVADEEGGSTEWEDFPMEEDRVTICPDDIMFHSMHEGLGTMAARSPRHAGYRNRIPAQHAYVYSGEIYRPMAAVQPRSMSVPRRRVVVNRPSTGNPAKQHRLVKIMSAVNVLMDELDQDGLRQVIDEAQRRIKKQH